MAKAKSAAEAKVARETAKREQAAAERAAMDAAKSGVAARSSEAREAGAAAVEAAMSSGELAAALEENSGAQQEELIVLQAILGEDDCVVECDGADGGEVAVRLVVRGACGKEERAVTIRVTMPVRPCLPVHARAPRLTRRPRRTAHPKPTPDTLRAAATVPVAPATCLLCARGHTRRRVRLRVRLARPRLLRRDGQPRGAQLDRVDQGRVDRQASSAVSSVPHPWGSLGTPSDVVMFLCRSSHERSLAVFTV